jgi:hypothetical protein
MSDKPALRGAPLLIERLEGAALFVLSLVLYGRQSGNWWLFALLILAPDISMTGYAVSPRLAARVYNAAHTLVGPVLLALDARFITALALIRAAPIGADRLFGYGLKYDAGFGFTHHGTIGRSAD